MELHKGAAAAAAESSVVSSRKNHHVKLQLLPIFIDTQIQYKLVMLGDKMVNPLLQFIAIISNINIRNTNKITDSVARGWWLSACRWRRAFDKKKGKKNEPNKSGRRQSRLTTRRYITTNDRTTLGTLFDSRLSQDILFDTWRLSSC